MDWIFGLEGDDFDLDELSKVFTNPDLCIEKVDNNGYELKSSHFHLLTSMDMAQKRAEELLISINAGIKLELGAHNPIKIKTGVQIDEKGEERKFIFLNCPFHVRDTLTIHTITCDGKKSVSNPAEPIISINTIAQLDAQVKMVCQYIGQDFDSWGNLYKIFEVIESDGFPPIQRDGQYKKMSDRFRRTANSFSASGLDSRHSKDTIPPPKNPMSITDAKIFIKTIFHEWLVTKQNKIT